MFLKTCFGIITVGLLSLASAAPAARDTSSFAKRDSTHQKWFAKQLNLSLDQIVKLKALREEMKSIRKADMEKMKDLRDKTRDELLKPSPNKTVLYQYAAEMGAQHKAISEQMAEHLLKVKAILTKEQFEKMLSKDFFRGMMQKGPGGQRGGHDHRGGDMPPPPDMDE